MSRRKMNLIWQIRESIKEAIAGKQPDDATDYTEELKEAEEELSIAQKAFNQAKKELSKADYTSSSYDRADDNLDSIKRRWKRKIDKAKDALYKAKVDIIVLDSAHGHTVNVINALKKVKAAYPDLPVIAGNVATAAGCEDLIKAGADCVKIGMGPGSICTTRVVAGIGVPQITAIMDCYEVAKKYDIPIIADGGIQYSGDIVKALAAGANVCMMGSMFAGTEESPGEIVLYRGRSYKTYRGMGSIAAMEDGSKDRYFQSGQKKLVPEGVEGMVAYKGKAEDIVFQMIGGIRSGMGYCGAHTIEQLQAHAEFVKITAASLKESHPHDITITKEAPNYSTQGDMM